MCFPIFGFCIRNLCGSYLCVYMYIYIFFLFFFFLFFLCGSSNFITFVGLAGFIFLYKWMFMFSLLFSFVSSVWVLSFRIHVCTHIFHMYIHVEPVLVLSFHIHVYTCKHTHTYLHIYVHNVYIYIHSHIYSGRILSSVWFCLHVGVVFTVVRKSQEKNLENRDKLNPQDTRGWRSQTQWVISISRTQYVVWRHWCHGHGELLNGQVRIGSGYKIDITNSMSCVKTLVSRWTAQWPSRNLSFFLSLESDLATFCSRSDRGSRDRHCERDNFWSHIHVSLMSPSTNRHTHFTEATQKKTGAHMM